MQLPEDLLAGMRAEERYGPVEAVVRATAKTWEMSALTLRMIWRMVVGDVSPKNISGPINIAQYAGVSATIGASAFLSFLAIVSISLGVLNLLPVPMLDGGQIVYTAGGVAEGRSAVGAGPDDWPADRHRVSAGADELCVLQRPLPTAWLSAPCNLRVALASSRPQPVGCLSADRSARQYLTRALAQEEPLVVRGIRVEGLQRIAEGTVFNYLPVNIGDRIDQSRIREAIRAVYGTGFFRDVEIRWDNGTLVVAVAERPSIADFTITGNKDIKTEDLQEPLARIGLKKGRTFNQSVLDEVEQSLTDQYFSRGKYAASVKAEVKELPDNKVDIAITIKEGDRARIRQINLVGNRSFSDEDLLERFELKTPTWLSWIRQDDRYSREALSGDLEKLRSFYMDRGFADFGVESTQVAISPDKRDIFVTINLVEGERYKVSDVRLGGDLVLPEAQLNPFVQVKPGQIYSQQLITQSADLIRLRLSEEGYAFATVEPVPELDREAKTAAVTLYVEPKNRVYVRRINFNGTSSVNDEVFRREMRQFEGGYLSNSRLERSKIRLQRLPYIEKVEETTNPVPGTPDLVDLDFDITEGLPGQFGGGVGYSASQKLILNGNFVHTNFMGTGNRVQADINTGRVPHRLQFCLHGPLHHDQRGQPHDQPGLPGHHRSSRRRPRISPPRPCLRRSSTAIRSPSSSA